MGNTKKVIAIIMAVIMICTIFVSCSKNNDEPVDNDISVVVASNTSETVSSTEEQSSTTENTTESTTKQETTTKKKVETTTKKKVTTTKKQTTTKKVTTTKKNVTAKEVQQQVNAYIKNKGIPVNATSIGISMNPSNSGWSGQISRRQDALNNGRTLQLCKEYVDMEIADGAEYLYCYYDSDSFYILYL